MAREFSQHLKDKLEVIEKETDFFSHEPEAPRYSRFTTWAMIALLTASAYLAFTSDDKTVFLLILGVAGIQLFNYLHQKQLFDMYSNACEIIKFYKSGDEDKI